MPRCEVVRITAAQPGALSRRSLTSFARGGPAQLMRGVMHPESQPWPPKSPLEALLEPGTLTAGAQNTREAIYRVRSYRLQRGQPSGFDVGFESSARVLEDCGRDL